MSTLNPIVFNITYSHESVVGIAAIEYVLYLFCPYLRQHNFLRAFINVVMTLHLWGSVIVEMLSTDNLLSISVICYQYLLSTDNEICGSGHARALNMIEATREYLEAAYGLYVPQKVL